MIDEDDTSLTICQKILGHFKDIQFYPFRNPELAIDPITKIRPQLLICDVEFKKTRDFNAEDYIATIKEIAPEMRVIICSAIRDESVMGRCLGNIKVDCYLHKPIIAEQLLRKTFDLVGEP